MFEQLFRYPATIRRHQEGPLAEERIQYLAFKSEGGSPRSTLAQTAPYLLTIATRLNLANNTKGRWRRSKRPRIAGHTAGHEGVPNVAQEHSSW